MLKDVDDRIPFVELRPHAPTSFHIRPIRESVDAIESSEPPHRHNFQELLWVKDGYGSHSIDDVELAIEPFTFYLIAKGQVHYFLKGEQLEGYLIRFTDDFLLGSDSEAGWDYRNSLFSHFAVHQSLPIGSAQSPNYERVMDWMWHEQEREDQDVFGRTLTLRHLLNLLLIQLERTRQHSATDAPPQSANATIYRAFVAQLDRDFRRYHHVRHFADALHVTPRQLNDVTRQYSGKTAKNLIQDRLIVEAKRYLQHTDASVKEVAFSLGFTDPSYFSKVFKEFTGIPPLEYKAHS